MSEVARVIVAKNLSRIVCWGPAGEEIAYAGVPIEGGTMLCKIVTLEPGDPGYQCQGWAESDLEHKAHLDAEAERKKDLTSEPTRNRVHP